MTESRNITEDFDILSATRRGVPATWLLSYLQQRGISAEAVCDALDIDEVSLISHTGIMTIQTYLDVFNWAAKHLDSPLLGAQVAEAVNTGEFGIFAHLANNGPSLRESFDFIEKYHCIFSPDFDLRFSYSNQLSACHYQQADIPGTDSRQDIEFALALIVRSIRENIDPSWQPFRSCFTYPPPEDKSGYIRYFGDSLHFNQPENLIEFETTILDTPNIRADPNLLPFLITQANQLLNEQETQNDIVRQVRLLVTTTLGYKPVTTEAIAKSLNVSVRHLHRLLGLRNTSFRLIKDETILKLAKEALIKSELSITEIAMKLNYSETSAFDRMFKKHTGFTPLQYRKKYSTNAG